jgi:hypothetical protein
MRRAKLDRTVDRPESDAPPPEMTLPDKTRSISVFYATGKTLVEERHIIADDKEVIKTTLIALLAAQPKNNTDIAIVQPECDILAVTVDDKGAATVDFSREVLDFEASKKEKVLAYGAIIETLKQFEQIKSVKFSVEGQEKGSLSGKDVHRFWNDVSLIGQPWKIDRKQTPDNQTQEETSN